MKIFSMPINSNSPTVEEAAVTSSPSPLRLGVVLDSCQVPAWICYLLRKLASCEAVDLCLVILDQSARDQSSKVAGGKNRPPVLFRLWTALDRRIRRSATDALRLHDCGSLLSRSGRSAPVVLRIDLANVLTNGDIASIKAAELDLLLHLGHNAIQPEAIECAHLGVWLLRGCDTHGTAEVPDQFWDMCDGNPVFTHGPQVIERTQNKTRTLYRSHGITSYLSLALNQNAACWNLAEFLVRKLCDAVNLLAGSGESPAVPDAPRVAHSNILGSARATGFLMRWAIRSFRHEVRKRLFREQWRIALRPTPGRRTLNAVGISKYLQSPRDRFYADPFLIERNGRTYLFFEDYRFATGKGLISCCEVDDAGNCGDPSVALECDYHLSYPFLFEWRKEIYLIPETRENRTIEMYRASKFPYSWVREAVLMPNVAAVDSTLLNHRGRWWLFTAGVLEHSSPNDTLFLYFADSPLGPWTAHPKNPIVCDPRRARPAGCLYFESGSLIRPAQDCSQGYGYAIQLHRVDVLSETDYRETPLTRILPSCIPGSLGTHTINQTGKLQVMDGKFLISRFSPSSVFASANQHDSRQRHLAADRAACEATNGFKNWFVGEPEKNSR